MKNKIKDQPLPLYIGQVDHVSTQYAYIIVEGMGTDILVSDVNLQGAWHGDTVEVQLLPAKKGRSRPEGKVVSITARARYEFIGQIERKGAQHVLVPDHKRLHHPILLPEEASQHTAQKAVVEVTKWPKGSKPAKGTVTKTLGEVGTHRAETEAIILQFGFSSSFPPMVEQAANSLPATLSEEEIARRKDFREVTTLTIDPDDAKDFDDALSLQVLPNGRYQIGIHIADVSHYVKKESAIDQEALRRGTSVYLVGETIPMLPERLSNDQCSLRPNADRPAFAVVVEMDDRARVQDIWVGETIIHSDKRLTYDQAKQIIEKGEGKFAEPLQTLHKLAEQLRQKRMTHGAIPFHTTDFNIHLDEAGEPIHITPKQSSIAHQLIEEFMLLANRLVAEKVYKMKNDKGKRLPFLYRIHDQPDPEKLLQLSMFAKRLGYTFQPKPDKLAHAFHSLLAQVADTPHQHIIQSMAIRTMAQARYTTEAKPHFGLAFPHYTHFTSPIRRYPDLIVHRLLKQYLSGNQSTDNPYEEIAIHTSQRERSAVEAERASINYKQVVFMQKLEGKKLKGLISHITQWGIYVEIIENKCEGMIRLSDLKGDFYIFEQEKFRLRGKRSGKTYQIGDTVDVQIKSCDLEKRNVDLIFAR